MHFLIHSKALKLIKKLINQNECFNQRIFTHEVALKVILQTTKTVPSST